MKTLTELTDADIDALEAGPTIDALIADVTGLQPQLGKCGCSIPMGGQARLIYRPSTCWDTAMEAAEKVELLSCDGQKCTGRTVRREASGEWHVGHRWGSDTAIAPTGPLAICRAILKLAKSRVMETANA